jgi:tetratricopeptide (TPR) repeat protein
MNADYPMYPNLATDSPLAHALAWIDAYDYKNAIGCCDFVLDHWDSDSFDALYNKGYALFCLEKYGDAIDFLDAALSLRDDDNVRECLEDAIRLQAERSPAEDPQTWDEILEEVGIA